MLLVKLLFFLSQVHFVVANEGANACTLYASRDDSYFDCREVTDVPALAVCLLQRNTLYKVLQCTNYDANQELSWNVETGGQADYLDIIPYYDTQLDKIRLHHNSDGRLAVTPRGLLLVASHLRECQSCGLQSAIARCPYSDFNEFISCLCCEEVQPHDISCLEQCIFGTSVGNYAARSRFDPYKWLCDAYCRQEWAEVKRATLGDPDRRDSLSCNADVYRVSNGKRVNACDDESFSTITMLATTPVWSKLSQPTITPSTSYTQIWPNASRPTDDGAARVEPYQTAIADGAGTGYIGSEGHAIAIPLGNSIFLALLISGKLLM